MEVYYSDAPEDPAKADVFTVQPKGFDGHGRVDGRLMISEERVLYNVRCYFADNTITCRVNGIDITAAPDKNVALNKDFADISVFRGEKDRTFIDDLERPINDDGEFAGIGKYYFGARYYDPELGAFTSTDPIMNEMPQYIPLSQRCASGVRLASLVGAKTASQIMDEIHSSGNAPEVIAMWQNRIMSNPYSYCFNNPINYFDPDGRWGLAHFFMTFVQEFSHQVVQAFKEIGTGLYDIGIGTVTFDGDRIRSGYTSLGTGVGRLAFSPIEALGVASYSMMPDIENYAYRTNSHTKLAQFLRWAGVAEGGNYHGAHGGRKDFDEYVNRYKDDVHSSNPFKRWRAKGHLAHTAQDAHLHRNKNIQGTWKEVYIEALDWFPLYSIPGTFFTWGDYDSTVYGY